MNYMSWQDLISLLDWSGLRPMSELEFEKAGRGSRGLTSPIAPVGGEYAWGSTNITMATSITNDGASNERGNQGSNIAYDDGVNNRLGGPLRVGSFAKGITGNMRENSGGSFYGVMELSGNLWERIVPVAKSGGRVFEGRYHGDGVLGTSGASNSATWPQSSGAGFRGGSWSTSATEARLSNRSFWTNTSNATRSSQFGGRGVRTAP